jgi:phage terminase small subunit
MAGRSKLTVKQEKYAQGLFAGLSQREAYKQAYNTENMGDSTIDVEASKLANDHKIAIRIEQLNGELKMRNMATVERVLAEYARLSFFDPRQLFNPDGSPKEIQDLDDDTASVLAGLDITEIYEGTGENRRFVGYSKKYKLADKKGALDSIAKHLGMFVDRSQVDVTVHQRLEEFMD